MKSFHILLFGQVQGVGFRRFIKRQAESHSVYGYVRNLPNGTVEVLAQTKKSNFKQFVKEVKDYKFATITSMVVQDIESEPLDTFTIEY